MGHYVSTGFPIKDAQSLKYFYLIFSIILPFLSSAKRVDKNILNFEKWASLMGNPVCQADNCEGAPNPLDNLNVHLHLGSLINDDSSKEGYYKAGSDYKKGESIRGDFLFFLLFHPEDFYKTCKNTRKLLNLRVLPYLGMFKDRLSS